MGLFEPSSEQLIDFVAAMSDDDKARLRAALGVPLAQTQGRPPPDFAALLADPALDGFTVHYAHESGEIGKVEDGRPVGACFSNIKSLIIS